ncbi:MAG: AMIN domain-containing protein [Gemmatimonadaceae bacterium]
MMGMSTVALMAAAFAGTALSAKMPVIGFNAHPVHAIATTDSTPLIRGQVSGVSVSAGSAGPEVRIAVDAAVSFNHFTLESPHRVVIDLAGAEVGLRVRNYDGVARGPVRNVRISQFRADTVRLVIDLDSKHAYKVARDGASVTLSVEAPASQFASWDMSGRSTAVAAAPKAAEMQHGETQHGETQHGEAAGRLEDVKHEAPAKAEVKHEAPTVEAPKAEVKHEAPVVEAPKHEAAKVEVAHVEAPQAVVAKSEAVKADAPVKVEVPVAAPVAPVVRRQQVPQQKPRISIDFDGTDIRDVIATFAKFSGRSIIAGKDVTGTVTANISDKPWDVALQAILSGQGLAATEDASGIINIDSYRNLASNQSLEPLVTRILDVNYAKASTLMTTVQKLLARDCTGLSTMATGREMGMGSAQGGSGGQGNGMQGQGCVVRGSVAADSATNKLIITEVPTRLPEIIARLQELDIRTPQVAIKAKIVFINRTGITDIGLAYDLGKGTEQFFQQLVPRIDPTTLTAIDTDGDGVPDSRGGGTAFKGPARIALGGNAISGIANAGNAIKPNALNLIYSAALGKYQLTTFLNALTTSSLADVQSEPSVTILNNRTATIFVGQEIPIRVIDASAGGSGGGGGGGGGGGSQPNAAAFFPRATVTKEEAGIKLTVTPQITNNRMVLLDMIAENSSAELANTDIGVIFNRQKAQSQVLVADGEAAVIGGLTVTEKSKFRSGIPFLMNLPYIGRLFSQNSTTETKRDLLILVTPHILDDGAMPPRDR